MDLPDLPPGFDLVTLREGGDAFAEACALAPARGAGTLVWVRRRGTAEVAVVLEPEEALGVARGAVFAGMNALADALAEACPPEKPLAFGWPDTIWFDGGLVGGGRLGWPAGCREAEVPDWLVFALMLRVEAGEAVPPPAALRDEGFEDFDTACFVGAFARHLMLALDEWATQGPASQESRWRRRQRAGERRTDLAQAVAKPSWLDAVGDIRS